MTEYQTKTIEQPITYVDTYHYSSPVIVIDSHINSKGKMILDREEAMLLWVELYKFIQDKV